MKFLAFFVTFLLVLAAVFSSEVKSADFYCSDYGFIFARGSGQHLNDSDFTNFENAILNEIKDFDYEFYELGTKEGGYDAVSVANFSTALGAYISAGESYRFGESVERGKTELIEYIREDSRRCKNKKYVLVGYSQGALVLDKAIPSLDAKKILYVATFGDPRLYLPEGRTATKTACKRRGLSPYRVYVPDCHVIEGVLSAIDPYQPNGYYHKLGTWCNRKDFMCGSGLDLSNPLGGHTSYSSDDGYAKLAKIVLEKIQEDQGKTKKEEYETIYSDTPPKDVVFLYDLKELFSEKRRLTKKSIPDGIKERLLELVRNNARVAVYNVNGYIDGVLLEEKIPFTMEDLDLKIDQFNETNRSFIGSVYANPDNNIYYAIKEISNNTAWRNGAERQIYVYTNHISDRDASRDWTNYQDAISAALKNNVKVSFISDDGTDQNLMYQEIMDVTGGTHVGDNYELIRSEKKNENNLKPEIMNQTFLINKNSDQTLVVVNDVVYGVTNQKKLTILNLDQSKENKIILVPYDNQGNKRLNEEYTLIPKITGAPDCGLGGL